MPMRVTRFRFGLLLAVALLCGSCSRSFQVVPSGYGTNVRLAFYEQRWFGLQPREACVSEVRVAEEQWPRRSPRTEIWRIKAIGRCVTITGVDIGHVPEGFREEVDRLPLRMSRMYGTSVNAEPYGGGYLPWFVCRQAPAAVGWKNEQGLKEPPARCSVLPEQPPADPADGGAHAEAGPIARMPAPA